MIRITQTRTDGLGGGNCVAACIASIFERSIHDVDVPCGGSYQAISRWTGREYPGVHAVSIDHGQVVYLKDVGDPNFIRSYWVAYIPSKRTGGQHAVVMHGRDLAWDPYPQADQDAVIHVLCGQLFWVVKDPARLVGRHELRTSLQAAVASTSLDCTCGLVEHGGAPLATGLHLPTCPARTT